MLAVAVLACTARTSGRGGGGHDDPPDPPPRTGWTDPRQYLVASDGTHSLGDGEALFNATRDRGSKIVFFDAVNGNNDTAEVYWWDGANLVDSQGRVADSGGRTYGTDPLHPDLATIKPFRQAIGMLDNDGGDPRLRSHHMARPSSTAGSYPDWFLFRRGQVHDTFDGTFNGGRSETEPVVVAAYGPLADGRAVMAPVEGATVSYRGDARETGNPFANITAGLEPIWLHQAFFGLEFRASFWLTGSENTDSYAGGPVTALFEDCAWIQHQKPIAIALLYLPKKTSVRRSVVANVWTDTDAHTEAYYTSGFEAQVTFDEVVFYRNGYHTDPATDPDPLRDIYSRSIYEGGGAWMGHTYRGIVSADGSSGGPQMRLGGLCQDSLIVEGYWSSGTESNGPVNDWLTAEAQASGHPSAVVRNNVQLVFAYPSARDPDSGGTSDVRSQPGWGYALAAASFNSVVEGNIISNAMLEDELGSSGGAGGSYGILVGPGRAQYADGVTYTQRNNTVRGNIFYRTGAGLVLDEDWAGVTGNVVENNVFAVGSVAGSLGVPGTPVQVEATNLASASQLTVRNNRFYAAPGGSLPTGAWMGSGNTLAAASTAKAAEGWPDPDRTLRRYVTEVLGLTLLDWGDDPFLARRDTGTSYDPMGLKTFMAVATNMRFGGTDRIPTSGKPSWSGDYPWDERYTGKAVVSWIREGFGLPRVE